MTIATLPLRTRLQQFFINRSAPMTPVQQADAIMDMIRDEEERCKVVDLRLKVMECFEKGGTHGFVLNELETIIRKETP